MAAGVYRITHRSRYAFAGDVCSCRLRTRLTPAALPHQDLEHHQIVVRPLPHRRGAVADAFGNRCEDIDIRGPIGTLDVCAVSVVRLREPTPPSAELSQDWRLAVEGGPTDLAAPSARTSADAPIAAYARASFPPGRALNEALHDLLACIARDFAFAPGATTAESTLAEFWEARRGVCQDHTHLLLACLRSLGLAARYMSGYLAPQRDHVRASHAWASIRLPSGRWHDVDPTRAGHPGRIVLAWGRDHDDAAPLSGIAENALRARLDTTVEVRPALSTGSEGGAGGLDDQRGPRPAWQRPRSSR